MTFQHWRPSLDENLRWFNILSRCHPLLLIWRSTTTLVLCPHRVRYSLTKELPKNEEEAPTPLGLYNFAHLILGAEPPRLPACISHKHPVLINLSLAYPFVSRWIPSAQRHKESELQWVQTPGEWFSLKQTNGKKCGFKTQFGFRLRSSQWCFSFITTKNRGCVSYLCKPKRQGSCWHLGRAQTHRGRLSEAQHRGTNGRQTQHLQFTGRHLSSHANIWDQDASYDPRGQRHLPLLVLVKACGVWVSLSEANPLSKSGAFLKKLQKVPFVAQQERISLASMRTWVRSPASLSGWAVVSFRRRGSDQALLWLWCRPVAIAPIGPLACKPPYAVGVALKRQKFFS